jgi:hypothetical protein
MRIKTEEIFVILNCVILVGLYALEPPLCAGQQWGKRHQEQRAF